MTHLIHGHSKSNVRSFKENASPNGHIFKYLEYLDKLDLSEGQKIELLTTLQNILKNFVDRAFGHDAVQMICAQRSSCSDQNKETILE